MHLKAFSAISLRGIRQQMVVRVLICPQVLGKKAYKVLCLAEKIISLKINKYTRKL